MSVEKNPNGPGYRVRWRDSAGKQRSKTVTLWRDAVALDGELKRKRAMGQLIDHERGRMKLCDFWELWRENYGAVHVTARTLDTYTRLYTKHLSPTMGHSQLRAITPEHVSTLTAKLNKTLAPSSVRQCLAILQGVLERAVEWGYIPTNPAKGVRKPRLVQRRGRALTEDEMWELVAAFSPRDLRSRVIVQVLAGAGIRPGELRGLYWSDVLNPFERIFVTRAASSDQLTHTKTGVQRQVEPMMFVLSALKELFLVRGRPDDRALVFPGADGRVWTDQGWRMWQRQVFAPAAARAGLKGVVPYDLRHTFASQRIAEGADILTLANQLGHSPTMTLTVYGHLLNQGVRDAGQRHQEVSSRSLDSV